MDNWKLNQSFQGEKASLKVMAKEFLAVNQWQFNFNFDFLPFPNFRMKLEIESVEIPVGWTRYA